MKVESSNELKLYVQPQMKVIEIASSVLLAGSGDPDPKDDTPDVIYPNLRD